MTEKINPEEKAAEKAASNWTQTVDWADGFGATQLHFERAFEAGAKWQRKQILNTEVKDGRVTTETS